MRASDAAPFGTSGVLIMASGSFGFGFTGSAIGEAIGAIAKARIATELPNFLTPAFPPKMSMGSVIISCGLRRQAFSEWGALILQRGRTGLEQWPQQRIGEGPRDGHGLEGLSQARKRRGAHQCSGAKLIAHHNGGHHGKPDILARK